MFHVLDHAEVVYSGNLSQSTQYVIEHYDKNLDLAIRSGIRILYSEPVHQVSEIDQNTSGGNYPDYWRPIEDWKLD